MSNKPVLIVEHCTSGLKINESVSKTNNKFVMEGTFTEFDVKNRNDRVYTANGFLPYLDELLERKKELGVVYGEFDHPDVFDTSLSRVSHVVENAWFDKEHNRVDGQIVLLDTHWGKEAKAIVNEGYPIFVSSRAAGVTDSVGQVELKKLFTYDCVADPGFSSARMNLKSVNESFGYGDDAHFRFYEAPDNILNKYQKVFDLSNDTKTNELFEMDHNDLVTKKTLTQYSDYLVKEINSTKSAIQKILKEDKTANVNEDQLTKLAEYYEALNEQNKKVVEYMDYLATKVQVVVNENKKLSSENQKLKKTTQALENKHTQLDKKANVIAENVEKNIEYSNYLAENLEKNITYSEYLAENVDKNISYSEYLAENLDKNISYSEYLAENVDKNISYSEYLAENLDKNISYSEYLAENVDKNISYSEYIAENLNANIKYSEYLAENLDASVAYQEYIAENLDKGIKYSEYVAECVDNTMSYAGLISETLNENKDKLNEGFNIKNPSEFLSGGMASADEKGGENLKQDAAVKAVQGDGKKGGSVEGTGKSKVGSDTGTPTPKDADASKPSNSTEKHLKGDMEKETDKGEVEQKHKSSGEKEPSHVAENAAEKYLKGEMDNAPKEDEIEKKHKSSGEKEPSHVAEKAEVEETLTEAVTYKTGSLTSKIDLLITEAKKREVSVDKDPHFYKFLNRSQVKAFESLNVEEQEDIKVTLNESSYYSATDILKTMREVLNAKQASPEERLLKGMPEDTQSVWESLNENQQNSVIAQSKFYVLDTEDKIENFWKTRKLAAKTLNEAKVLIEKDDSILNEGLSDAQINSFMERFDNLK